MNAKRARPGEFIPCSVNGCGGKKYSKGMCLLHYGRMSRLGRVDLMRPTAQDRFWQKVRKSKGCWEWTSAFRRDGYGVLSIHNNARPAHRFSWEIHFGEIPDGKWVLHKCDNKKCVRPDHLFLGDSQSNVDDMITKGRQAVGEAFCTAKLSELKVREIIASTQSHQAIADSHGVCRQLISSIKAGKKWRHVK